MDCYEDTRCAKRSIVSHFIDTDTEAWKNRFGHVIRYPASAYSSSHFLKASGNGNKSKQKKNFR